MSDSKSLPLTLVSIYSFYRKLVRYKDYKVPKTKYFLLTLSHMPKGETWISINHSPSLSINFSISLSIHPSLYLSIIGRFALEELANRKRRLTITLKGIPKGLSTTHHGVGKLSILLVLAWFENGQYLEVAWRRRPYALCACRELADKQSQSGLLG